MNISAHDISNAAEKPVKRVRKPSSKRFYLMYVCGGTDPIVIGKARKSYDSVLKAAQKFIKDGFYKEGEDGIFYLVTTSKTVKAGSFESSEIED